MNVSASRDAALAAKFAAARRGRARGVRRGRRSRRPGDSRPAGPARPKPRPSQTVERLAPRTQGVEYEIPVYKYEASSSRRKTCWKAAEEETK